MSAEPAARDQLFAGEPAGVVGSEENGDCCDVVRLAGAAQRGLSDKRLFEIGADDTCAARAFGLDYARVDRIDADFPRAEFLGEHAGDGVHGAFSARINGAVGGRETGDGGAYVD